MVLMGPDGRSLGMDKNWEDMGVHTKLSVLRNGIGELMKMNLLIMKKVGVKVKEEEDGREETRQPEEPAKHPSGAEGKKEPCDSRAGGCGADCSEGVVKGNGGDTTEA